MKYFLEPRSVAIIGVSRRTGEGTFNILENLLAHGYQGKIYPVNPNTSEILGIRCYPSVAQIAEDVDLAIVATPRELVLPIIEKCVDNKIGSIVVVGQGFADAGDDEGKQLQKAIVTAAKNGRAKILGPNTFGTANAFINFSSAFVKHEMEKVPIGIICQSGVFFFGFPGLKLIGKGIDLGNACDIDFADGLEYFELDKETNLIVLHIEGTRAGKRFLEVVRRLARKKPILAFKTGISDKAAKAAQSHTGSLVGKDEIWEVALRQAGIIRVTDLDELQDLVTAFSLLPSMKGKSVGVITFTGGLGIVTIDACHKFNMEVTRLSLKTKKLLSAISPSWLTISNPVDIWPAIMISDPYLKGLRNGFKILLPDPEIDGFLFIGGVFSERFCAELCQLLEEQADVQPDKPLVCYLYGPYANDAKDRLKKSGKSMGLPTPDRAIRVLGRLAQYSEFHRRFQDYSGIHH
jgi:acetyltransferase